MTQNKIREYKFRGKRIDNEEYVFGNYVHNKITQKHYIFYSGQKGYGHCEVIPETVSQYTERKDKNGVEMYEGDRVRGWMHDTKKEFIIKYQSSTFTCGFIATCDDSEGHIEIWYKEIEVIDN